MGQYNPRRPAGHGWSAESVSHAGSLDAHLASVHGGATLIGRVDGLEPVPATVREARLFVRSVLEAARRPQLVDDAELPASTAEQALALATYPDVGATVHLPVPLVAVPLFHRLDQALESAHAMADRSQLLTPPVQPELSHLRRWLCGEVSQQRCGRAPVPWTESLGKPAPSGEAGSSCSPSTTRVTSSR
jgi:hypothetical protein